MMQQNTRLNTACKFLSQSIRSLVLGSACLLAPATLLQAESTTAELPSLGLASTLDISLHQERSLGQGWLRQFRSQNRLFQDPLTQHYTEQLMQRLATYNNALEQKNLDVLLVDQRQLNAFAVPGGVVGVNTGLFLFAANEDEFASVAAHELAHISQRHFARRVEAAQGAQWATLAGLLAGILVASQGHADAGVAAIAGTQAAAIQNQLAWSRSYEQEADRIGMETLVAAGYSPEAMPRMFTQMQRIASLSGRPPEFLLTHPLTQSRIADAQARADQMASRATLVKGKDYEMIRVRVIFHQLSSAGEALEWINRQQPGATARTYAQALKAQADGQDDASLQAFRSLVETDPEWLLAHFLLAEELARQQRWEDATAQLEELQLYAPGYYPALFLTGDLLVKQQKWDEARRVFQQLSQARPQDPDVWYQLAEVAGKANRQIQLHQARAEYFQLTGRFRQAMAQLDLAMEQARLQDQPWGMQAALRERKRDLENLRSQMEF